MFPHKDVDAARKIWRTCRAGQRKLLITDGVFSMDGDLGALPELCALAEEFGCIMMVDDAHASGVFGANGRGTIDHFGMHGRVDIQVGTLSKAIGALGGYVAGSRDADRVPLPSRAAVPVLDVASAGGRRHLHRGDRRARAGAADHRSAVGEHALLVEFHKELLQTHDDNQVVTVPTSTPEARPTAPDHHDHLQPPVRGGAPGGRDHRRDRDQEDRGRLDLREGVQLADLAQGPGHYPGTPLPGQIGDAAIAGHRTTHGAPFYHVD